MPVVKAKQNSKQGLGNHFIFLLTLSNCLFGLSNIWIYISSKKQLLVTDTTSLQCSLLAFLFYFFDLSSLCWITSLSKLFFSSTIHTEYSPYKEKRLFLFSTFYSVMIPFLIACIPLVTVSYSFVGTHCALDYGKRDWIKICMIVIHVAFVGYNLVYQVTKMYKISKFYKEKMFLTKGNYSAKFGSVKWYILIFKIFPIYLILTKGIVGLNKLLYINTDLLGQIGFTIFNYVGSILSCLDGTFTVILCLYFFKSVLCCGNYSQIISTDGKTITEDCGDDVNDVNFGIQ